MSRLPRLVLPVVLLVAGVAADAQVGPALLLGGGGGGGGGAVFTPVTASWHLVFDDEFNGSALNSTNWPTVANGTPHCTLPDSSCCAPNPANVSVGGGTLTMKANNDGYSGCAYSSSFIQSSLTRTYGYFEILARMSRVPDANSIGHFPSFWMNNAGNFPELDAIEQYGYTPTIANTTYHGPSNNPQFQGTSCTTGSFNQVWHVIGMYWNATNVQFYLDGVNCFTATPVGGTFSTTQNMLMDANLGSFAGGPNAPTGATTWPMYFDTEYVHVYCNPADASCPAAITPDTNYGGPGSTVLHSGHP